MTYRTFIIEIETENNAFYTENNVHNPEYELARILRKVANKIETQKLENGDTETLQDVNGNSVGIATFVKKRKPIKKRYYL